MSQKKLTAIAAAALAAAIILAPALSSPAARGTGGAGEPVYLITGRGRAHGVGLCMDGVLYRALEGQDYRSIINYYYTGVQFTRTDEAQPVRVKCRDGAVRAYSLKDYLYRLQEEPETYPFQGLKVLYVAARTYVLSCIARAKHTREGFDICSSGNCCQAFDEKKNLALYPNNCRAVDQTPGEVLTSGGKVITAAYCGSCGGHTENNEDVWGSTPIPYLRGKTCGYCWRSARYAWSVSMKKSELEARLNGSADTQVGRLGSINVLSRTPGGRVKSARLSGSLGSKVVSGGTLSARLGLQSSLFELAPDNFDEYILVLNPNPRQANITFTFMKPDGTTESKPLAVAANARKTLKVDDHVQFQEVSTRVTSDLPVVCERAMYFNYRGCAGGHASTGANAPAKAFYFAEGYTGGGFDTYILVENPGAAPAEVRCTFMTKKGDTVARSYRMAASSRLTVSVDAVPGLSDAEVSTVVECTSGSGVVAERSVYFDYSGSNGGSCAPGAAAPATTSYLAEGYTGGKFDTYVLLQNPGAAEARVEAAFMREDGKNIKRTYSVKPHSRRTVAVDSVPGMENASFSTRLVSRNGVPFVAERSMYFDYNGLAGGHDSGGVTAPAPTWLFAEGYTGGSFDTYLLLQNPEASPADVRVTFVKPSGQAVTRDYALKARSRMTVPVDRIPGLENTELSMRVQSLGGTGIIAERAVYFNYREWGGGTGTAGVNQPSTTWLFAEGYTGY